MTILTTDRLTLRPPCEADREQLVLALNNLNVSRWTGRIPFPYGPEDADVFLTNIRRKPDDALVLFITRTGTLMGCIGIEEGELGYWLAEPHWGQGYGTEAARAMVDHAFEVVKVEDLVASYHIGNAASRCILLGLGFAETGEGAAFSRARQAEVPHIKLRLTPEAWREAKERRR